MPHSQKGAQSLRLKYRTKFDSPISIPTLCTFCFCTEVFNHKVTHANLIITPIRSCALSEHPHLKLVDCIDLSTKGAQHEKYFVCEFKESKISHYFTFFCKASKGAHDWRILWPSTQGLTRLVIIDSEITATHERSFSLSKLSESTVRITMTDKKMNNLLKLKRCMEIMIKVDLYEVMRVYCKEGISCAHFWPCSWGLVIHVCVISNIYLVMGLGYFVLSYALQRLTHCIERQKNEQFVKHMQHYKCDTV